MDEKELKQMRERFFQLLIAVKLPKREGCVDLPIIFKDNDTDVRKLFATGEIGDELVKNGYVEFVLSERTISTYLLPDKYNFLLISIEPLEDVADGEAFCVFAGKQGVTGGVLNKLLHKYLTDLEFKKNLIEGNENYIVLPKEKDSDELLQQSKISFIQPNLKR